ncbi:MAG TPA: CPBP family intramembrane metalloprotease [Tenuifilaceae bacterium]|nr:CPBP family intramembrane metalloprotease [Tenuifilaceae bacterium]HRX31769.1 CPBP family intramembrane metalloprotease [Tenuifilaceae bacterium]
MTQGPLGNLSDTKKILFLILLILLGGIVFSFLGSLVIMLTNGVNAISELAGATPSQQNIGMLKTLQIFQSIGMFLAPGLLAAYLYSNNTLDYLGFHKSRANQYLLVLLLVFVSLPGINFLSSLNELIPLSQWMNDFEAKAEVLTNAFMETSTIGGFLLNLLMIAIIPAFGEEIIFRGILQKHFISITKKRWAGILITAALFSAFHLQFKGFVPRMALGVIFGYIYAYSNNIWLTILAHFTNNALATVAYTAIKTGTQENVVENVGGLSMAWPLGVASIALVILILMQIKKNAEAAKII